MAAIKKASVSGNVSSQHVSGAVSGAWQVGAAVMQYASLAEFPEAGKIHVLYVAIDTNTTYRWDLETEAYVAVGSGEGGAAEDVTLASITGMDADNVQDAVEELKEDLDDAESRLSESIAEKLDAPTAAGTAGQVLTHNAQGEGEWQNPTAAGTTLASITGMSALNVQSGIAELNKKFVYPKYGEYVFSTRKSSNVNYINVNNTFNITVGDTIAVYLEITNLETYKYKYCNVTGIYHASDTSAYDMLMRQIQPGKWFEVKALSSYELIRVAVFYDSNVPANAVEAQTTMRVSKDSLFVTNHDYKQLITNNILFEPAKLRYGAHRGARLEAPENSIPAIRIAGESGYDWVWLATARQSKDGTWYIMHDSTVDRTTNGTGQIADLTDAYLATVRIDVGANIEQFDESELKIPTLYDAIKEARKYGVNVTVGMGSLAANHTHEEWQSFIEEIKACGADNAIFYGDIDQINSLKNNTDNWHGCLYVDTNTKQDIINGINNCSQYKYTNISIMAPYAVTDEEVVRLAHSHGYKYIVCNIPENDTNAETIAEYKRILKEMCVDICQSAFIHE